MRFSTHLLNQSSEKLCNNGEVVPALDWIKDYNLLPPLKRICSKGGFEVCRLQHAPWHSFGAKFIPGLVPRKQLHACRVSRVQLEPTP